MEEKINMKIISQEVIIAAKPKEVYDAFMDEKQHTKFTGARAKIENVVGGKFEVWDGYASGKNIELKDGEKIVQSWRASDWPEGVESEITIELIAENENAKLVFHQKNVPDDFVEDVKQGWEYFYWEPLQEYFE